MRRNLCRQNDSRRCSGCGRRIGNIPSWQRSYARVGKLRQLYSKYG
ncbi:MAG: DUF1289 domain-containing protein [Planctomycetaceae bacterium]|nr:DUF1289 domain-containing protein [Planctomycetaceae bacterium]